MPVARYNRWKLKFEYIKIIRFSNGKCRSIINICQPCTFLCSFRSMQLLCNWQKLSGIVTMKNKKDITHHYTRSRLKFIPFRSFFCFLQNNPSFWSFAIFFTYFAILLFLIFLMCNLFGLSSSISKVFFMNLSSLILKAPPTSKGAGIPSIESSLASAIMNL